MVSLRQLLDAQAPLLLLDAAGSRVHVGFFPSQDPAVARWSATDGEAGVALFQGVGAPGVAPIAVRAFAFCEAPGSILGIRTTAMAIRTWCAIGRRPAFAYDALSALA